MNKEERVIIDEPIITIEENAILNYDKLRGLRSRIEYEINELNLDNIEATEENKALLKETRSKFNVNFKELEEVRLHIRRTIEKPYQDFLEVYKEETEPFKEVDKMLKDKIDEIEDKQREEKENELRQFFNDLKELHNRDLGTTINLNFLEFENMEMHITLSASMNKLREELEEKIVKIKNDLVVVRTHEMKARLFGIYQDKYDLSLALIELNRQLELENKVIETAPKVEETPKIEEVEEAETPKVEEIVMVNFAIKDTKTNIQKVVNFMRENGVNYENL